MKSILFIFLTVATTLTSNAQNSLVPSKKVFDKKWVKNTTYEMVYYILKDTAKMEIGKVTTQITVNKKQLLVVTNVAIKGRPDTWVDSTSADSKTLKPIRHSSYNTQRDMVLNFGKIVTGFYNDKIKKQNTFISDTTKTDYFDSNLYSVLLGWLPLKEGYKNDIAIYDYNPQAKIGVLKASIKNVTSGRYQSDKNGIIDVWIVTVTNQISSGEANYYFGKADRKLWKQEMNPNGRMMMMKLIE